MRLFSSVMILFCVLCTLKLEAAHSKLSDPNPIQTDLSYAKHIDVHYYIVTRQQLSDLFSQKEKSVTQLSTKELHNLLSDVYFLIRVKNTGDIAASGILHCIVPCCGYPFPIKIMKMPPKMKDYYDFIIQFDTGLIRSTDPTPLITYEWSKLDCYSP